MHLKALTTIAISLLPAAAFAVEPTPLENRWQLHFGAGYAKVTSTDALETNKSGYSLMAKGAYGWKLGPGQLDLGAGLMDIAASGEKNNIYQSYDHQGPFADLQYRFSVNERASVGPWLMMPFGRGSQLKYQDPDSFQASVMLGANAMMRFPRGSGDWLLSIGALVQPGVGTVTAILVPVQIGYAFGRESVAALPATPSAPQPEVRVQPVVTNEEPIFRLQNPALYFNVSSAELSPDAKAKLRSLAQALKTNSSSWSQLVVYGFTDASGKPAANASLANRRAISAKKFLVENGLPPEKIKPLGRLSPKERSAPRSVEDRRVEIEITIVKDRATLVNALQEVR